VEYFTADQMRAFAEEAVRLEREAKARAEQDEIVNAAIEWYGSSHKDEPEHRLAMAVLRFKTAIARSQEGQG
jgi:imidazolonepropionase-like amidohydrolase